MGKLIFMRRFWEYGKRMKIRKLFEDNSKIWNRQPLFDAVWKKDTETATKEMNKLLRKTISYHDYKEDFYHAFLAGIFAGAGYMVESNKEHGEPSVITITERTFITHFLPESLREQDMRWNQTGSMEKAEVMWLFMTL